MSGFADEPILGTFVTCENKCPTQRKASRRVWELEESVPWTPRIKESDEGKQSRRLVDEVSGSGGSPTADHHVAAERARNKAQRGQWWGTVVMCLSLGGRAIAE